MLNDSCPNCGYHKPYMMSQRSDSSLRDIWNGEDGTFAATLMRLGAIAFPVLILTQIGLWLH